MWRRQPTAGPPDQAPCGTAPQRRYSQVICDLFTARLFRLASILSNLLYVDS
jgi:hypothetical protein